MNKELNEFPWSTACIVILTILAALVGGAVVIWGEPGALSFEDYLKSMAMFAGALGLLGIGRGIRANAKLSSRRGGS
jgi:heme A synthase